MLSSLKPKTQSRDPSYPGSSKIVIELSAFPNDDFHKGSPPNSQNLAQGRRKGEREERKERKGVSVFCSGRELFLLVEGWDK